MSLEKRLREEIKRGVQTIQYQVVTLMTTNGQAPFITVFMYLGEARNPQEKADLAIIIEETILQHIDQFGERGSDPDTGLVLDALVTLAQHLLNDDGR